MQMPRLRQRISRRQAIDLLIEAKVVAPENRSMVLGSELEIVFGYGGVDADKDGFFKRSEACRLIGVYQIMKREGNLLS